ncbi:MAG: hypothetical protein JW818_14675 [Pirellulales bacterium]|nr:hypothetical protein [Pirellulales bacterium]
MSNASAPHEADPPVNLKDPVLAAFLAWLLPGLGHLYQGRTAKAILFFVCIMGTYVYGLYLSSGPDVGPARAVYFQWKTEDRRLYYLCQIGIGAPALPALVQWARADNGRAPYGRFMAPPDPDNSGIPGAVTLSDLHLRLGRYFELATVYTAIAGLLNFLVIFDAFAGPFSAYKKDEKDDKEDKKDDKDGDKKDKDKDKTDTDKDGGPKP